MPQWIFPGITLNDETSNNGIKGIRIEFISLSRTSVLSSDLETFEIHGYLFRSKGKTSLSTGAVCTICFSRNFLFSSDDLSKIVADLYEAELKDIPEFMKIKGEERAIRGYLLQIVNSIEVFLKEEKLLKIEKGENQMKKKNGAKKKSPKKKIKPK